jgi:hypothetical protein
LPFNKKTFATTTNNFFDLKNSQNKWKITFFEF